MAQVAPLEGPLSSCHLPHDRHWELLVAVRLRPCWVPTIYV